MSVIIKEPVSGYIVGELIVTSASELRKLEKDFVVITKTEKEESK